jgi:hypothetical protein
VTLGSAGAAIRGAWADIVGGAIVGAERPIVPAGDPIPEGGAIAGAMIAGAAPLGGKATEGSFGTLPGCSESGLVLVVTPAGGARLSEVMAPCACASGLKAADSNAKAIDPRRMRWFPRV